MPSGGTSSTNISNSPKNPIINTENTKSYMAVRTNEKGDVWYTSEMLYKYRYYKNVEKFITSAKVIEIYDNYSILENKTDIKIEPMMIVKIKD